MLHNKNFAKLDASRSLLRPFLSQSHVLITELQQLLRVISVK